METTVTPFSALVPRLLLLDPLVRVYLTDDELLALRIGNQFSNRDSAQLLSRASHADESIANHKGLPAHEELAVLQIKRSDIVAITIDHARNFHNPGSLATVRIELAAGKVTKLHLLPESNVAQIVDLLTSFYADTITTGKPREATNKIKRSPQNDARQYMFLGCFFACHAAGFLWFSLQHFAHLPILLAVPLNIWAAVHCFRKRLKTLRSIAKTEIGD